MSKVKVGTLVLDTDNIVGYALINEPSASKYDIPPGLYIIEYFDMYSVQIAIDDGSPDFKCVSRKDFEWIKL